MVRWITLGLYRFVYNPSNFSDFVSNASYFELHHNWVRQVFFFYVFNPRIHKISVRLLILVYIKRIVHEILAI